MADNKKKAASTQLKTAALTPSQFHNNIITASDQANVIKKYTLFRSWIKRALPWWSNLLGQRFAQQLYDRLNLGSL